MSAVASATSRVLLGNLGDAWNIFCRHTANLWHVISQPPLRVAGWVPYELIFTLAPHLFPSAAQFSARRINLEEPEQDFSANVAHDLVARVNQIRHRVFPEGQAPRLTLLTSSGDTTYSAGGFLSIQDPALVFPERNGMIDHYKGVRGERIGALSEAESLVTLNKEETELQIIRESLRVKYQLSLIRVISLTALFALAVTVSHLAIPTLIGSAISWGIYILMFTQAQHYIERKIDRSAIRILTNMYRDEGVVNPLLEANRTMYRMYRKMQFQNLKLRESALWRRLYILSSGNNLWDMFSHLPVTEGVEQYGEAGGFEIPMPAFDNGELVPARA